MRNLITTYLFMFLTFGAYCQEPDLSNPKNYKRSSSFPYTVGQRNSVLKNVQKALGLVPTGNFDEYTEHILLSKGRPLQKCNQRLFYTAPKIFDLNIVRIGGDFMFSHLFLASFFFSFCN